MLGVIVGKMVHALEIKVDCLGFGLAGQLGVTSFPGGGGLGNELVNSGFPSGKISEGRFGVGGVGGNQGGQLKGGSRVEAGGHGRNLRLVGGVAASLAQCQGA